MAVHSAPLDLEFTSNAGEAIEQFLMLRKEHQLVLPTKSTTIYGIYIATGPQTYLSRVPTSTFYQKLFFHIC